MNKYLKEFLHRGLVFGGFGPIVIGVVYLIISTEISDFFLTASEVLTAIVSIYALAFLQAGASVFNVIEHWSMLRSITCHFVTVYFAYITCYLVNSWIPFKLENVVWFTVIFITVYVIIWLIVYLCVKTVAKRLNSKI
jgi:hypothetical protein